MNKPIVYTITYRGYVAEWDGSEYEILLNGVKVHSVADEDGVHNWVDMIIRRSRAKEARLRKAEDYDY